MMNSLRTPSILREPTRRRGAAVGLLLAASLLLSACGDDAAAPDPAADDVGSVADQAADVLEDADVDVQAEGTATVEFMGETFELTADEQFGCFLTEDGGSDGAVDFTATDDATVEQNGGRALGVDWAGDSPDSAMIVLTTVDGREWTGPTEPGGVDATVAGSTADVRATVSAFDGDSGRDEAELTVRITCGS